MKKISKVLFLAFVPLLFSGCLLNKSTTSVALTVSVEPTEIVFDKSLRTTAKINYALTNTGTEPIMNAELNVLKRVPGEINAEILHQEKINLEPQEKKDLTYTWNQDGVRSGDITGTKYEIYTQLVNENGISIQESTPVTITLTVPEILLTQ